MRRASSWDALRRRRLQPACMLLLSVLPLPALAAEALVIDRSHFSNVFNEERHYRIFLPSDYGTSGKRYPVIYWFHGFSERYNKPVQERPERNYDKGTDYNGDTLAAYVSRHDLIIVKWDGYNPRTPEEAYKRPYNISPVETNRQFPLYFPELVQYIDSNYRTLADREHRAVSGLSMGGFMSLWVAGKYPDMVSAASSYMPSSEFYAGYRNVEAEYRHEEMYLNYAGVRTRLITGSEDFIRYYHARLNAVWRDLMPAHETVEYKFDHGTPAISETMDWHMQAFAGPLPRPEVWSHADVYPNFGVWGWEVLSDRRQPGFTVLENVSARGFRSYVRQWLPGGPLEPKVKLTVITGKHYPPGSNQTVTVVRVADGKLRRSAETADADGRLTLTLDGDLQEIGIGTGPELALAGFKTLEPWVSPRTPATVQLRFLNKGAAQSTPVELKLESPQKTVAFKTSSIKVPALAPGASAVASTTFTLFDQTREMVKMVASGGASSFTVALQAFSEATPAKDFRVADGRTQTLYVEATKKEETRLGQGNGDGRLQRGETFAVLMPDAGSFRALELFTSDPCVDLSRRVSDVWSSYDYVGASAKYSLAQVRKDCPAGHVIRMIGRLQFPHKPDHRLLTYSLTLPVY
jgi:pimeloyl-ACP methyl ester carboxylesterase